MELWIRSTARTNLVKVRFLTIIKGKELYKYQRWEYKGYTICNCCENGNYEILGTYSSKNRAIEVLDEIQRLLEPSYETIQDIQGITFIYKDVPTIIYEMPEE